ncbi:MAG: ORF6N domain-containing protein [Candidatus Pacebacteria bacterium]|nr:ORF6N domain-containing protein [Candidatus Paceibacterota bacterium]
METAIDIETIKERIYLIRGGKVMLDMDLAVLYGTSTKVLKQSVKRNIERFPDDFMFKFTKEELDNWRSQFVTSNSRLKLGLRIEPLAFTEQGIAMLSSVLNSQRAIQINIQIIRIFTKLRRMVDTYKELREKVEEMEKNNETNFREIFRVIRLLIKEDKKPKNKIGFKV